MPSTYRIVGVYPEDRQTFYDEATGSSPQAALRSMWSRTTMRDFWNDLDIVAVFDGDLLVMSMHQCDALWDAENKRRETDDG